MVLAVLTRALLRCERHAIGGDLGDDVGHVRHLRHAPIVVLLACGVAIMQLGVVLIVANLILSFFTIVSRHASSRLLLIAS